MHFIRAFVGLQKVHGWVCPLWGTPFHVLEGEDMANTIVDDIKRSGLSIYDKVPSSLFIPNQQLEELLRADLIGLSLDGLPLRTRAKVVKTAVCKAIGYPVPKSFKKTQPRFLGQNFDVYTQQSANVQIWNEDIDASRRYVFLHANEKAVITAVRVISGDELASLDKTGTLTRKYQATMQHYGMSQLFSTADTLAVSSFAGASSATVLNEIKPNDLPTPNTLLSITELYARVLRLVGKRIKYLDAVQERNRGAELHALICEALGYRTYEDDGSYPDIRNQIAEIKLQTSPTIDLGLHSPLDHARVIDTDSCAFHSEDVRYIVFDASVHGDELSLDCLYVVNGKDFENAFPLFKGKVQNAKLQIPLPKTFFD